MRKRYAKGGASDEDAIASDTDYSELEDAFSDGGGGGMPGRLGSQLEVLRRVSACVCNGALRWRQTCCTRGHIWLKSPHACARVAAIAKIVTRPRQTPANGNAQVSV